MRIALLEDDPDQAALLSLWLEDAEYIVSQYDTASEFLRDARRESFDLYLIDWLLPDLNGIEVLDKLRNEFQNFTPAIVATIKNAERDVVLALEAGADDYLSKPIRRRELIARVEAVYRRFAGTTSTSRIDDIAPYTVDTSQKLVRLNDERLTLTTKEFELTALLFRNVGKVISRGHILELVWGLDSDDLSTRTVDTHISRLRKKLELNGNNGWKLSAIYQHGYRLEQIEVSAETQTN